MVYMRSTLASGSGIDVAVDCTKGMCGYSLAPTRMTFGSFSIPMGVNASERRKASRMYPFEHPSSATTLSRSVTKRVKQSAVVLDLARAIGHVGRGVGVALGRLVAQRIAA